MLRNHINKAKFYWEIIKAVVMCEVMNISLWIVAILNKLRRKNGDI